MKNKLLDLLDIATVQVIIGIFFVVIGAEALAYGFSVSSLLLAVVTLMVFLFCDLEKA